MDRRKVGVTDFLLFRGLGFRYFVEKKGFSAYITSFTIKLEYIKNTVLYIY